MKTNKRIAFENALDKIYKLPDQVKDELWQNVKTYRYKKGEYIFAQYQVEKYQGYLSEGIARVYQQRDDKEVSLDFRFGGDFLTAYASYISGMPSQVAMVALQDCEVFRFHRDVIEALYDKYHEVERWGRLSSEFYCLGKMKREAEILSYTAEERYLGLLKRNPDLVAKIPVKYLASYLGIHKQSLSRIRSKVRN